jgi:hypothetical protein
VRDRRLPPLQQALDSVRAELYGAALAEARDPKPETEPRPTKKLFDEGAAESIKMPRKDSLNRSCE